MPFTPELTENASLDEVRGQLSAAAQYALELRARPADQRGDTYADDVRSAVDFINFADPLERALTAGQRAALDQAQAAEAERLRALGIRGPQAAHGELANDPRSAGDEFVRSPEYSEWARSGGSGNHRQEVRTLLTTGTSDAVGSGAGVWRPVGSPQLNAATVQRRRLFVRDLLSTGTTGLASFPYIRELNAATLETGAAMTSEGSAKAEVSMTFVQADAPVRKVTAWIPATTEILTDAPTLRSYIDARLEYMVLLREEAQALAGNGTAPNLEGVTVATGHQTQTAVTGDVPATIAAAYGKIENVDGDPDGVAFNPLDYWGAIAQRHSTQFDNGFSGNAPAAVVTGALTWGENAVRTRSLSQGTAVAAAWKMGATLLQREAPSIVIGNQHEDYLVKNKVAIVCEERVALPIWRPDFFVVTTITLA